MVERFDTRTEKGLWKRGLVLLLDTRNSRCHYNKRIVHPVLALRYFYGTSHINETDAVVIQVATCDLRRQK
jgi:hypothetical protein